MFIDFLTLMLINMSGALLILAWYRGNYEVTHHEKGWSVAFLLPGVIAFLTGLRITFTWPLPGVYNVAFGELSVLLGGLFIAAGILIAFGKSLLPLGIYAFLSGLAAIANGYGILTLKLTQAPLVTAFAFIATGLGGVLLFPTFRWTENRAIKWLFVLILAGVGLLWAYSGCLGYLGHLKMFGDWKPATMSAAPHP
jgi:putative membrane protein